MKRINPIDLQYNHVVPSAMDTAFDFNELVYNIVNYLNQAIETVNGTVDNTDSLNKSYNELVDYVNTFKDNMLTKVIDESYITNLIDSMIESGEIELYIKSIQRGILTIPNNETTATALITEVNLNKAIVVSLGYNYTAYTSSQQASLYVPMLELTNANTITATRGGSSLQCEIGYEVIEFA